VATAAALGLPLMLVLDRFVVPSADGAIESRLFLGAVGLALASGAGAWLELLLLRRALASREVASVLPWAEMTRMAGLAAAAAVPAALLWWLLPAGTLILQALLVVGAYGAVYLVLAKLAGVEEVEAVAAGVRRRLGRR
jgi:peptidoglycan biosynthesis protein MviN/MurJ (putative lipid II flippase)